MLCFLILYILCFKKLRIVFTLYVSVQAINTLFPLWIFISFKWYDETVLLFGQYKFYDFVDWIAKFSTPATVYRYIFTALRSEKSSKLYNMHKYSNKINRKLWIQICDNKYQFYNGICRIRDGKTYVKKRKERKFEYKFANNATKCIYTPNICTPLEYEHFTKYPTLTITSNWLNCIPITFSLERVSNTVTHADECCWKS